MRWQRKLFTQDKGKDLNEYIIFFNTEKRGSVCL